MTNQPASGLFVLAVALGLSTSMPAYGQWYTTPRSQVGYGTGAAYGGFGVYGGAQTPGGANATGMGNLVRSAGEYNQLTAKAAIDNEVARSQYIDNQNKIFQERQYRKREFKEQVAMDRDVARAARERQQEFAAAHRPLPLSSQQLDTATGRIDWPVALKAEDFDEVRAATESLFVTKARYGAGSDVSSQIVKNSGEMKDMLRGKILNIPLPDYTESRKFLESMIASAR